MEIQLRHKNTNTNTTLVATSVARTDMVVERVAAVVAHIRESGVSGTGVADAVRALEHVRVATLPRSPPCSQPPKAAPVPTERFRVRPARAEDEDFAFAAEVAYFEAHPERSPAAMAERWAAENSWPRREFRTRVEQGRVWIMAAPLTSRLGFLRWGACRDMRGAYALAGGRRASDTCSSRRPTGGNAWRSGSSPPSRSRRVHTGLRRAAYTSSLGVLARGRSTCAWAMRRLAQAATSWSSRSGDDKEPPIASVCY